MKNLLVVTYSLILLWTAAGCKKEQNVTESPQDSVTTSIPDLTIINDVQKASFGYFWNGAHASSGMALERSSSGDVVTTGGTGFGIAGIVAATSRGWISRTDAVNRLRTICYFLQAANRFHGAWPHWLNGATGKVVPFSTYDNGGDLVETAFLVNGLLIARAYFTGSDTAETNLRNKITTLYEGVEWDWYARKGDNKLYWHWSPDYDWTMNLPISGWNEALITYVLAAASPTHPIDVSVYNNTWITAGFGVQNTYQGYTVSISSNNYIGPLFFSHYSFIGLDPRQLEDNYTNYWQQAVKHVLINRSYCLYGAPSNYGYSASLWGLTASDGPDGYNAFQPTSDNGTIAPTAALSSIAYTPYYSMQVMRNLYENKKSLYGKYGFYDALNVSRNWMDNEYLAIDQGPIVAMIENYRSGLLWNLFMNISGVKTALTQLGFHAPVRSTGFYLSVPEVENKVVDLIRHPDANTYQLDVYMSTAGTFTLEKTDGTVVSTTSVNAGSMQVTFNTSVGKYTARLKGSSDNITQVVQLH